MDTESLTWNLDHQLQHAAALRNLAYTVIVAEHKGESTRAKNLALTMFYRGLQTHEATEILVRQKLVEDARIVLRVLVEQFVNSAYMLTVADEQTVEDFIAYPKYWRFKLLRDLKNTDVSLMRRSVSLEREEEIRLEYEALHPRFKDRRNGEWCVDGPLHQRAAKVDDKLSKALKMPFTKFRWMVNSEWRFASSHVHGMADSLLDQVSSVENVMTVEQTFDPEDAATALYSANFALVLVLPLIDNELGGRNANEISIRSGAFTGHGKSDSPGNAGSAGDS